MGFSGHEKPKKQAEIAAYKPRVLEELIKSHGMPYTAFKELDISPKTAYRWKEEDKEFSSLWDEAVKSARELERETIKLKIYGIIKGDYNLHPSACSVIIFAAKALAGYSDQPEKKADTVNVLLPDWVLDKIKGKGDKPGKE